MKIKKKKYIPTTFPFLKKEKERKGLGWMQITMEDWGGEAGLVIDLSTKVPRGDDYQIIITKTTET
jgi:hypothetical protein